MKGTGVGKRSKSADAGASTSGAQGGTTTPPNRVLPATISTPDILARRGSLPVSSRQLKILVSF